MLDDQFGHIVRTQTSQVDPPHVRGLLQRPKRCLERTGPFHVSVAVDHNDQRRERATTVGQLAQELHARGISPLHVVEHEEHGSGGGHDGEQRRQALQLVEAVKPGLGNRRQGLNAEPGYEVGQESREVGAPPIHYPAQIVVGCACRPARQRVSERLIRNGKTLAGAPVEDRGALAIDTGCQTPHEGGLADARLSGYECRAHPAGHVTYAKPPQGLHLNRAANEELGRELAGESSGEGRNAARTGGKLTWRWSWRSWCRSMADRRP